MRPPHLAVLFLVIGVGSAHAQTARPLGYKDPSLATIVSIFAPGGGHLYAGETQKGAILLGIAWGGPLLALGTASCKTDSVYGFQTNCSSGLLPLALVASLGAWVYGLVDASNAAERHNATLPKGRASITPFLIREGVQKASVGLNLRVAL